MYVMNGVAIIKRQLSNKIPIVHYFKLVLMFHDSCLNIQLYFLKKSKLITAAFVNEQRTGGDNNVYLFNVWLAAVPSSNSSVVRLGVLAGHVVSLEHLTVNSPPS